MTRTLTPSAPLIQGVDAPNVVVNPTAFYANTRRLRYAMRGSTAINFGSSSEVELKQTGIVSALEIRVSGSVVFGGTIGTTTMSYEWPFNLIRSLKLAANGQSNLISCRGITLKALEFAANPRITDQGVSKSYGGSAVTHGTLAKPTDDWGTSSSNVMAPGTNVAATGTYTVDLTFLVPIASDMVSLIGSVYAQSKATNLDLTIDWGSQATLTSAVGASATVDWTGLNYSVTGVVYSIPNVNGQYVVPDLSRFHQVSEFRKGGLTQGENEVDLPGTGVGRHLLRVLTQVYSSAAPLAVNATNYGAIGWRYGGNDTPEVFLTGTDLAALNHQQTGSHFGRWGIQLLDFVSEFALRDAVDEGATSDLRTFFTLVSSPTTGYAQIAQETLFAAPVGA